MDQNDDFRNDREDVCFDEKTFLRKARFKSLLRITSISFGVVIGVFLLAFVLPEIMLQKQENRIDSFYPDLVRFSSPNTLAIPGRGFNVRLFGRQKEYYLIRLIGNKPYPAGIVTVDFDIWGGEQTEGSSSFCVLQSTEQMAPSKASPEISAAIPEGEKEYLAPYAVPKLRFYHPAVNYEKTIRDFDALKKIPGDHLVEMAVSFKKPLSLDEIKGLLPGDLRPMWGAVCAFKEDEYRKNGYLTEKLVGNPYLEGGDGQERFLQRLEMISKIPSHHSSALKRTVAYLKENGIKYFGVVVVGNPRTLEQLASNPMVTGAVLGIVTAPY